MASDVAIREAFKKDGGTFASGFIYAVFCLKQFFAGSEGMSDSLRSVKQDAQDSPEGVNTRFIWKH
jgi:hypothetical protein